MGAPLLLSICTLRWTCLRTIHCSAIFDCSSLFLFSLPVFFPRSISIVAGQQFTEIDQCDYSFIIYFMEGSSMCIVNRMANPVQLLWRTHNVHSLVSCLDRCFALIPFTRCEFLCVVFDAIKIHIIDRIVFCLFCGFCDFALCTSSESVYFCLRFAGRYAMQNQYILSIRQQQLLPLIG